MSNCGPMTMFERASDTELAGLYHNYIWRSPECIIPFLSLNISLQRFTQLQCRHWALLYSWSKRFCYYADQCQKTKGAQHLVQIIFHKDLLSRGDKSLEVDRVLYKGKYLSLFIWSFGIWPCCCQYNANRFMSKIPLKFATWRITANDQSDVNWNCPFCFLLFNLSIVSMTGY